MRRLPQGHRNTRRFRTTNPAPGSRHDVGFASIIVGTDEEDWRWIDQSYRTERLFHGSRINRLGCDWQCSTIRPFKLVKMNFNCLRLAVVVLEVLGRSQTIRRRSQAIEIHINDSIVQELFQMPAFNVIAVAVDCLGF